MTTSSRNIICIVAITAALLVGWAIGHEHKVATSPDVAGPMQLPGQE